MSRHPSLGGLSRDTPMTRWAYPALMAALIGLVCAPLILHPDYLLYPRGSDITDLTITHWPAVAFNSQTFHQEGQIPLWRTTIASGGPWAANPQSWLFYPPAWLFFILPLNLTFNLLLLAHLALAAGATFVFGRRALGLERPGAALAGLAFALAPWLTAQLAAGHVNVALALAWLPVALLGAHHAALKSSGGALLAGVAWAACVFNHPQIAAFTIASTVAWFLLAAQGRLSRQVISLFIMATIATLLSAALLIPLVEALPYLSRGAMTVNEAGVFSLSWTSLLAALVPAYGGEAEQTIYLGVPVAILAAVGLTQKQDRIAWFLAGGVMLSLLFALGTNGPIFPFLFRWVPGLAWLRVPARAWGRWSAFSLALLAGRGLDAITRPRLTASARRRITLTGLVVLTAGLTLAIGLAFCIIRHPAPPPAGCWHS